MKLINADDLKEYAQKLLVEEPINTYFGINLYKMFEEIIDHAPAVDLEKRSFIDGFKEGCEHGKKCYERPQGEWIRLSERLYKCKNCGYIADFKYPFCHCGADMRGDNNGKSSN